MYIYIIINIVYAVYVPAKIFRAHTLWIPTDGHPSSLHQQMHSSCITTNTMCAVSGFSRRTIKNKKNKIGNAWLHHINNRARHNLTVVFLCTWRYKSPTLSSCTHKCSFIAVIYIIHICTYYTFVSRPARCTQHNHPRIPQYYAYRYII